MTMINHNHTHQWDRIGVIGHDMPGPDPEVVYQCDDCDAWTTLRLDESSRVPFRQGELATSR